MIQERPSCVLRVLLILFCISAITELCVIAEPSPVLAVECESWLARVVSAQGTVQARRVGETRWIEIRLDDLLCPGDMVRVQENSRAALLLRNEAIIRLDQNSAVTLPGVEQGNTIDVDFLSGVALFFSRFPFSLRVLTPFVNAHIEGTEFLVQVSAKETFLSVYEGKVNAVNDAGSLLLVRGQSGAATAGQAPSMRAVARPRDAVRWALYYPPIPVHDLRNLIAPSTEWGDNFKKSVEAYRRGDLALAFDLLKGVKSETGSAVFYAYRAFLYLSVGRVDEAESDLRFAASIDPQYCYVPALQSVIETVRNRKDVGLDLAKKAVALDRSSSAALIALSYAQQAKLDLDGALASVRKATEADPRDGLAWARLAELWLMKGYLNKALDAAQAAAARDPGIARTQTVLGYAYLTQINISESKKSFRKAIELDQADPLPRLGLGLALIRDGDLKEGRTQIEIAAMLDPNNSLIRSYLGKAYFDEKRDERASLQFELAKELDPLDPTPWFYEAIQKETQNRPVEALDSLEKSIKLNDNRAVYRSRLMLDQDLAARSAGLARIYQDLGFGQRALVEGWRSLNSDPANYSAHRFLADAYATMPRHDIARVSELLQSQLLQPLNLNPIQPQMAEKNLFLPLASGPANPSFNEYNALFTRNRANALLSGAAGEHGTLADEAILSGVYGRYSASVGQFHHETDGTFRNSDLRQNLYNAFFQTMVTPNLSILAEYRNSNILGGDPLRLFSETSNPILKREARDSEAIRLGMRASLSPNSQVIGHFSYSDFDIDTHFPDFDVHNFNFFHAKNAEAQYIYHSGLFSAIVGGGTLWTQNNLNVTFFGQNLAESGREIWSSIGYAYTYVNWPENMTWTLGLSGNKAYDVIRADEELDQVNPKVGLTWNVLPGTTIRAAAFRTMVGPGVSPGIFSGETIEPTQVAGFNQYFDEPEGTSAWRYGAGIDQKFTSYLYGGVEYSQRDVERRTPIIDVVEFDTREKLARAYLYWTPHPWFAIGPEYQFEQVTAPDNLSLNNAAELDINKLTLGAGFFHPCGFFGLIKPAYVFEEAKFIREDRPFPDSPLFSRETSDFFVLDAVVGYRLPRRMGFVSIEGRNLFDRSFRYQDIGFFTTSFFPERSVLGRITLFF